MNSSEQDCNKCFNYVDKSYKKRCENCYNYIGNFNGRTCFKCNNYTDDESEIKAFKYKYIIPTILLIILYFYFKPYFDKAIPEGLFEKVYGAIISEDIHISHLGYMVSTICIIFITIVLTIAANAPWWVRVIFLALFLLFSSGLYSNQNIFILDDMKKEKKQYKILQKHEDVLYLLSEINLKEGNLTENRLLFYKNEIRSLKLRVEELEVKLAKEQ